MSDRDKLIELISYFCEHMPHMDGQTWEEACADHLIANGVTILPDCKGCQYEKRKRPQKCSCCRRNKDMADLFTPEPYVRHWTDYPPKGEQGEKKGDTK